MVDGALLQPGIGRSACFSVSVSISVSVSVIVRIDAGVDACFSVRVDVVPGADFGVGKTGVMTKTTFRVSARLRVIIHLSHRTTNGVLVTVCCRGTTSLISCTHHAGN